MASDIKTAVSEQYGEIARHGVSGTDAMAIAAPAIAATRPGRVATWGPSSATNDAGNAASRPHDSGSPMTAPSCTPRMVPRFQNTNTDSPVAKNACRAAWSSR